MFLAKVIFFFSISFIFNLIFADGAWAWGPAIHTVLACGILNEVSQILPVIGGIIQSFRHEYIYGSFAADFLVGKGQKKRDGHSHNWETGFRFLKESKNEREAAYAYGFLSHLAADVIAHNYFVPDLINQASTLKRMGHLYWEVRADYLVGPVYMRIAKDILSMKQLGCDDLIKLAVGKRRNGIKARRQLFTQSVKLSDFFSCSQSMFLINRGSRYQISNEYLIFMINLSYRLMKDFLNHPFSSPCLSYDPIGSRNLRLASHNKIISKIFNIPRPKHRFNVDQELLKL